MIRSLCLALAVLACAGCASVSGDAIHTGQRLTAESPVSFTFTGDYVQAPRLVQGKAPAFPFALYRKSGGDITGGYATATFTITADGRTADIRALERSHPQYAAAVVEAIRQWRFEPARLAGNPTVVTATCVTAMARPGEPLPHPPAGSS